MLWVILFIYYCILHTNGYIISVLLLVNNNNKLTILMQTMQ